MTAIAVEPRRLKVPQAGARAPWRPALAAAVLYLIAACLRYWPVPPWSSTEVLHSGNHDPAQMVWLLAWTPFAVGHGLNPLFSTFLDAPRGANLATSTSMPFLGLLGGPTTALFGPITTFNLLMRFSLAGSAFTMCLVLRRWVTRWPAAFVGGAIYGFSSYQLWASTLHLNLAFLVVPPLMLAALDELLVRQERASWATGLVLGVLVIIQWFVDIEILVDCVVLGALGALILGAMHRHVAWAHLRRALPGLVACASLSIVVLAYPAWYVVAGPQSLKGPVLPAWLVNGYRVDLLGPLLPGLKVTSVAPLAQRHLYYLSRLTFTHGEGYVGIPLALVTVFLAIRYRRAAVVRFATFMALLSFVLSLGSPLSVLGHSTSVPLPSALFAHLPLLDDVEPLRITGLTFLFLALIVGVALDRFFIDMAGRARRFASQGRHTSVTRGWATSSQLAVVGTTAIATACLVPLWLAAPPPVAGPVADARAAKVVARVTPPGGTVLFLPWMAIATDQPMVWQAESTMAYRMVGGYALVPATATSSSYFLYPRGPLAKLVETSELPAALGRERTGRAAILAACRATTAVVYRYQLSSIVLRGAPRSAAGRALTLALGPPQRFGHLLLWDRLYHRLSTRSSKPACRAP